MAHSRGGYVLRVNDSQAPALRARPAGRCRASVSVASIRWQALLAAREERRALVRLGEALAAAPPLAGCPEAVRGGLDEIASHDAALAELTRAVEGSLQQDRADWARTSAWARPLVVARGILARGVVRDRAWRTRRARHEACRRLAVVALEAPISLAGAAEPAEAARAARAIVAEASAREAALLAPYGGALLPAPVRHVGREAAAFGKVLLRELRGHLVPRVPALAGLVVGWWVTRTFTDSRWSAALHRFGIGSGPTRALDGDTYRALKFWLPLLAAALCSYAGGRLAVAVRARYAPADPAAPARPAADRPAIPPPSARA